MKSQLPEFDELMKLAQENPEQFEELRQQMCDELIQSAPSEHRRRLRGLQFQIDMERRRAKTPMAACMKISSMMHDSFAELRDALNELQDMRAGKTPLVPVVETPEPASSGNVVSFPSAKQQ